jgi:hypothetical protein
LDKLVKIVLLLIINCSLLINKGLAQNLVPNPSFEDTVSCPVSLSEINATTYWFNPNIHSPDYFNSCSDTSEFYSVNVPNNYFGYQNARTGVAYTGIGVAGYNGTREYIEIKLIDSLATGSKYCVEFYVSLSDSSNYSTDDIGIYISNDSIYSSNVNPLPYVPQVENVQGVFINDKSIWTLISGEYTALGGEQYITIGNFKNASSTDTIAVSGGVITNGNYKGAYYYIDDVAVTLCDSTNGFNEYKDDAELIIYPNPANDVVFINTSQKIKEVVIYNLLGESVKSYNSKRIDTNMLVEGSYILIIKTENNIYNRKLILTSK